MKTKKFSKKLSLNKRTVAHLDNREMGQVRGGVVSAEVCVASIIWRLSMAPETCRLHGCPLPPTCIQNSCGC